MTDRSRVAALMAWLDSMWASFDALVDAFSADDWRRKHGADWVFADVPYHLAYFDNEIIAYPLAQGPNLPSEDRMDLASLAALQAWNASQFARRSAYYAPDRSLTRWRTTRAEIRASLAAMTDADLARPTWMALPAARGWRSAEFAAITCLAHAWNEFMELRFLAGRDQPEPAPEVTHAALEEHLRQLQLFFDPAAAANQTFTTVWTIDGAGGGQWTFQVADGRPHVTSGAVGQPDLAIALSALTFVKLWNQKLDRAQAIAAGEVQVSDLDALATFDALYPPPDPATPLPAAS